MLATIEPFTMSMIPASHLRHRGVRTTDATTWVAIICAVFLSQCIRCSQQFHLEEAFEQLPLKLN